MNATSFRRDDQIGSTIDDIRVKMNLSMIFITHDLRVAAQVCDRIVVMRYGKIVEVGTTSEIFSNPTHDYSRELLNAVPGKGWEKENKNSASL